MASLRNYKQFYALLSKAGMNGEKESLCRAYSEGRTESLKELSDREFNVLIANLQEQVRIKVTHDEKDKKRKKLIAILADMGYVSGEKPDMEAIYKWVKEKGCNKPKSLNQYTSEELSDLIYQVEQIAKYYKHKDSVL